MDIDMDVDTDVDADLTSSDVPGQGSGPLTRRPDLKKAWPSPAQLSGCSGLWAGPRFTVSPDPGLKPGP
jgi:hypothetical protein